MSTAALAPRTLQTGHVGLNVTDLDRSVAFYRRLLGLDVAAESGEEGRRYALLGRDGTLVLTLWEQSTGSFAPGSPGLHHLSFRVDTVEEVRAAEAVLKELGAAFAHEGVVPHGEGADSGGVFFTDPDGIRLEIFTLTGVAETDATTPDATAPTCGFF
ncbi:VOC family protein [Kitasatospora sp. NPDC085879]|uniref:VOC family protein n=1 Tax=Kitasatospora sp. NPDC085879 TaxID=3154769 RepID=UPI000BB129A9|nr:VOC family protein [Streptomyces sp. TLI_235]PBC78568.1 glyoxalase/bleomycin resistance protein/dioxygenase superfamily protein [Streptomyces sp. TLI_235]